MYLIYPYARFSQQDFGSLSTQCAREYPAWALSTCRARGVTAASGLAGPGSSLKKPGGARSLRGQASHAGLAQVALG